MNDVYVVVPAGIDDPARPSGGNTYDRRVCEGLAASGWSVHPRAVPGAWPLPDAAARAGLAAAVAAIPDGAVLLLDGLVASTAPGVLVPEAARLRLVVLVHLPLGTTADDACVRERAVLFAAAAVVTTSAWTRDWLLDRYALRPDRVHVATPGVDVAAVAPGTPGGGSLLCVAAVTRAKGHDVLLAALGTLADLSWRCTCVGSLDRAPAFTATPVDGVCFTGPLVGADLDATYASADVLVLASRFETYGMVVADALARALPVVATEVGGLPEALGRGDDGTLPGLLVPPEDPTALAAALRRWLTEPGLRSRCRDAAAQRRTSLRGWSDTAARVSRVLADVSAGVPA